MRYSLIITTFFLFACKDNKSEPTKKEQEKIDSSKPGPAFSIGKIYNSDSQAISLSIDALPVSGGPGQVTFTRNDSTIFYFRRHDSRGTIKINQQEYSVNRMSFNNMTNTYRFSGKGLHIVAPSTVFRENNGEDCAYGSFHEVTVRLGRTVLKLKNIQVQDCPEQ